MSQSRHQVPEDPKMGEITQLMTGKEGQMTFEFDFEGYAHFADKVFKAKGQNKNNNAAGIFEIE